MVRENCYCENANSEDTCYYNCFKNANMEVCADAMYEDEFDLQEAVECVQLEVEDEDAVKNYIYSNMAKNDQQNAYNAQNGQYNGQNNGEEAGEVNGDLYVGPFE